MTAIQPPLIEVPSQPLQIGLFHDVSGSYGRDQWIVWGYLFCKRDSEELVSRILREARGAEGCWSPLHFADLPGSWGGAGKHKPRTAYRWINRTRMLLASDLWFHAFALDTRGSGFNGSHFPRKFHLNNRFCRMGLTSAIPWFFKGVERLSIEAFFHRQSFEGGAPGDGAMPGEDCDNLGEYIIRETTKDAMNRHKSKPTIWPAVEFPGPVRFLSIDPADEDEVHHSKCELLQLTDVMLGAIRQAIDGTSRRKTKRELASIVGEWAADVRRKPWEQKYRLHRRFSVSYFPGPKGEVYPDGPLRLSEMLPGTKQYRFGI